MVTDAFSVGIDHIIPQSNTDLFSQRLPAKISQQGRNIVSLKLEGKTGVRTHDLQLSKQAALTTAPGSRSIGLDRESARRV